MITISDVPRGRFTCETGTESTVEYLSQSEWNGHQVSVHGPFPPCDVHELEVMHHYDDEGRHYCPTGFLWCPACAGTAHEPEPPSCTLWGKVPGDKGPGRRWPTGGQTFQLPT